MGPERLVTDREEQVMRNRVGVHSSSALAAAVLLSALFGGCTIWLTDQEAFQTGKVLERGQIQATARSYEYHPIPYGSLSCGLGRGLELGIAGGKDALVPAWNGLFSATQNVYSSRNLFGSASLSLEGFARPDTFRYSGARVSATGAPGYYPWSWLGVYAPVKLSYIYGRPDSFAGTRRGEPVTRHFPGVSGLALVPGVGLSFESRYVFGRIAYNCPLFGPSVTGDSLTTGFVLVPYLGAQVGVRIKLF
jgi:hypothetical protein